MIALNKRITIKQLPEEQNSFGEAIENWPDVATIWASLEPLTGREFFSAQQNNSEINIKIRIRYRTDLKSSMCIIFGERKFEIMYIINPEERNIELILMCKELL